MENSKEKQIEEMAFNLIMATSPLGVKDLTKQFDYKTVATDLYEQYGWRKSSDIAREIFEEIEKMLINVHIESFENYHNEWVYRLKENLIVNLAELKKKYTQEK